MGGSAVAAVMSNADLVSEFLTGTIGPSTLVAASRVCKLWHSVCRSDERVLRLVALYQGGVTKSVFCGMFALAPCEADGMTHTTRRRRKGGLYHLFGDAAVADAMARGGMAGLRARLTKRANTAARRSHPYPVSSVRRTWLQQARLEDMLHAHVRWMPTSAAVCGVS